MRKAISQKVSVGEQPRQSDLEELKKDGVTTVVNLRVAGEDTSLTPTEERALAEKLGLQYHHLPISLDKLDAAQVKELREILHLTRVRIGLFQHALAHPEANSERFEGMKSRPSPEAQTPDSRELVGCGDDKFPQSK